MRAAGEESSAGEGGGRGRAGAAVPHARRRAAHKGGGLPRRAAGRRGAGGDESPAAGKYVGGERERIFPSPLSSEAFCLSVCLSLLETRTSTKIASGEAKMDLPPPMPQLLGSV